MSSHKKALCQLSHHFHIFKVELNLLAFILQGNRNKTYSTVLQIKKAGDIFYLLWHLHNCFKIQGIFCCWVMFYIKKLFLTVKEKLIFNTRDIFWLTSIDRCLKFWFTLSETKRRTSFLKSICMLSIDFSSFTVTLPNF